MVLSLTRFYLLKRITVHFSIDLLFCYDIQYAKGCSNGVALLAKYGCPAIKILF